jgi:uncharacterized coiled-coil protein SlyX
MTKILDARAQCCHVAGMSRETDLRIRLSIAERAALSAAAFLFLAIPAVAQQSDFTPQLDSASAQATAVISSFRGQIIQDQAEMANLRKQLAMMCDALHAAKPEASAPGCPSKQPAAGVPSDVAKP